MALKYFLMKNLIKNLKNGALSRNLIKSIKKYFIKNLIKNLKKCLIMSEKDTLSKKKKQKKKYFQKTKNVLS